MAECYRIGADTKYLCVAVQNDAPCRKITMRIQGELVYELDVCLAEAGRDSTTVYLYAELTPFEGKELSFWLVEGETEIEYVPKLVAQRDGETDYNTHLRPRVHFTSRYGWNNDPNGLIYVDNVYHMFYQHNPVGVRWGNMHWGHATSGDLIHWVEKPEALYPDKTGTMYSGSAIADSHNVLGLKNSEFTPFLLYYTAAGNNSLLSKDVPFTQRLAYSSDGGMTFQKYDGEPMLPHIVAANRDPKVIWAEELGKWVMALYLDGNDYALFTSGDLLHWTQFQTITLHGDSECPDFYPLNCVETKERLWVLSGASDTYMVGLLSENGFHPIDEVRPYRLGGGGSYAAQTFSGLGDRIVKIAWGQMSAPEGEFCSQMLIPVDVTLHHDSDGRYRMATNPIPAFNGLRIRQVTVDKTASQCCPLRYSLGDNACDITLRVSKKAAPVVCELFGMTITLDASANVLRLPGREIPLGYPRTEHHCCRDEYSIRFIVDSISLEVFADGGRVYTALEVYPDFTKEHLMVYPIDEGVKVDISADIAPLHRIW